MNKRKQNGFSLLEVILVISIVTIGLLGVFSLVAQNIQVQNVNKNYLVASMLAQEGLELVRNIRDTNWLSRHADANETPYDWKLGAGAGSNSDIVQDGAYVIDYSGNINDSLVNIDSIDDIRARLYFNDDGYYFHDNTGVATTTDFYRLISVFEDISGNYIVASSTVRWKNAGRTHNYAVETYLYDWR